MGVRQKTTVMLRGDGTVSAPYLFKVELVYSADVGVAIAPGFVIKVRAGRQQWAAAAEASTQVNVAPAVEAKSTEDDGWSHCHPHNCTG